MTEKNMKKLRAKRNRVYFGMRLGTITFSSPRHPERNKMKRELYRSLYKEGSEVNG